MYFVFEIKFSNLCKCVRKKDITQNCFYSYALTTILKHK